jgi:hypothetical protein
MSSWIDCQERLPERDGTGESVGVLIYAPCEGMAMEAFLWEYQGQMGWATGGLPLYLDEVTHWMPMPPPPGQD